MRTEKGLTALASLSVLALSAAPSFALVVMISDLSPAGSPIEDFFRNNFTNVTEIRHGNYSSFAAQPSQDALLGAGAFAGRGAADVFVIGRSLGSADYASGNADGYNGINIPLHSTSPPIQPVHLVTASGGIPAALGLPVPATAWRRP